MLDLGSLPFSLWQSGISLGPQLSSPDLELKPGPAALEKSRGQNDKEKEADSRSPSWALPVDIVM